MRSLPYYLELASPEFLVLTSIRVNWGALKKDRGSSIAEGSIHHIAVSCDPTDVSHTTKDITWMVVKHELRIQERTLKNLSSPSPRFPPTSKTQSFARQSVTVTATTAVKGKVKDGCRDHVRTHSPAEDRATNTDSDHVAITSIKLYMVHEPRE